LIETLRLVLVLRLPSKLDPRLAGKTNLGPRLEIVQKVRKVLGPRLVTQIFSWSSSRKMTSKSSDLS